MPIIRDKHKSNYTIISNNALRDTDISIKSRGFLAVILSLPDDWNFTVRGLAKVCGEGLSGTTAAVKELEGKNYIKRVMRRGKDGRIIDTVYTVYENTESENTESENTESENTGAENTEQQKTEKNPECEACGQDENKEEAYGDIFFAPDFNPSAEKPYTENPSTVKPKTEKRALIIKDKENKDIQMTDIKNPDHTKSNHDRKPYDEKEGHDDKTVCVTDGVGCDEADEVKKTLKNNISYDALAANRPRDVRLIDSIVELMTETLCTRKKELVISGSSYKAELVKRRLMSLEADHIEYVVECINTMTTKVRNIKKYMLAMLFNAPVTIEGYYCAKFAAGYA